VQPQPPEVKIVNILVFVLCANKTGIKNVINARIMITFYIVNYLKMNKYDRYEKRPEKGHFKNYKPLLLNRAT